MGVAKRGFWAEALPGRLLSVVHTNRHSKLGPGRTPEKEAMEWEILMKGSNVLAEALEKVWILTGPHPHFDPVFYTLEWKLAKDHISSGRGRSIVHYTEMPSLVVTLAGG